MRATQSAVTARVAGLPGAGAAFLREAVDAAAHLLGLRDVRADRAPLPFTIRIGGAGVGGLILIDRRAEPSRSYRLDMQADDFVERLLAIRGGQSGLGAKVVVDPGYCFARTLVLPSAALPRMRAVLEQELEATTPFRPDAVYGDWFVEGEDSAARTLRVRHVVLKRTRLDPLLTALGRCGLVPGPVTVGADEARTMPIDLLTGGYRALPGSAGRNITMLIGSALLLLAAFWGFRQHQASTLAALDEAFATARRAAGPAVPTLVQASRAALLDERAPPLARTWDALAAALPDTASASMLRLDAAGAEMTLTASDEGAVLAALSAVPGFGPAVLLREARTEADGGRHLVLALPRIGHR